MSKLKPCPFCGGEAVEKKTGTPGNHRFEVVCSECGCKTFKTVASPCHIEAWNTRAERTCKRFWTGAEMICSLCAHQLNNGTANYCPNCGAKVSS